MALTPFSFVPPTGYEDTNTFPTNPGTEAQKRSTFMVLLNQVKTYVNSIIPTIDGKLDRTEIDTWHTFTFSNSWVNYGGSNSAGYKKDNLGYVHLRGLIKSGTLGAVATNLPVGYRPEQTKQIVVMSYDSPDDTFGEIIITADGNIKPQEGNNGWISLDNITFYGQ